MKKLYLLLSLLLIGCQATPLAIPSAPISAIVQFEPPTTTAVKVAKSEELDLYVGIYAASTDVAFLFGSLMAYDGEYKPIQSTLLRSADGGLHWKEVLYPVSNSRIDQFAMLESGVGWILMINPEPPSYKCTLYQTTDYGLNWKEMSVIPLSSGSERYPVILQMIFIDELHGQIDMLYYGSSGYLEFLTTNDGGVNWKQSGIYEPEFEGNVSSGKILDSYISPIEKAERNNKSFSLDHSSYWNLADEGIERQIYNDDGTKNIQKVMFPYHFHYVDGQIVTPTPP